MAMKEPLRVTLDARQIREACESYVGRRINCATEEARAVVGEAVTVIVVVSKRRGPRKPAGVPSSAPLSEAEQRFA